MHYQNSLCKSKILSFFKSHNWHLIRSIACRLSMIIYSIFLTLCIVEIFEEIVFYLNLLFIFLIIIDGFVVIYFRNGLEDVWCSFSILAFVLGNSISLFMLELNYSQLWQNIFQSDFIPHIESHYRRLSEGFVLTRVIINNVTLDSDKIWLENFNKDSYKEAIGKFEASFCFVLILSRLFLPQATLTWSTIGNMIEYSFNTLFDVYTTFALLRESRYKLPMWIVAVNICISNLQLTCIALNNYTQSSTSECSGAKLSPLRSLVENSYFQFIIQVTLAELPFLIMRIVVAINYSQYVKAEIYYTILKQSIIVFCKIAILLHYKIKELMTKYHIKCIMDLNNFDTFDSSDDD